ncbi:hypothetical protein CONPUDRAFT_145026, partial [Coniophora puteana RWD-64-598 SS2]
MHYGAVFYPPFPIAPTSDGKHVLEYARTRAKYAAVDAKQSRAVLSDEDHIPVIPPWRASL